MKNKWIAVILPHISAIIIFLTISLAYFSPVLEGKILRQHDNIQYRGMSKEIVDFRAKYHKEPLWTNSMFGGMPAYLVSMVYSSNLFRYVDKYVSLTLNPPVQYLFLTLLGFYFLLVVGFRVNPWLSIAGAIVFAFSSYFFIILAAGHNTKAHAIAYIAPVLTGIVLSFRGKLLWGGVLTGVFLALQMTANHPQITYYTLFIVLIFGIVYLIQAIKEKTLPTFFKTVGVLVVALALAIGVNITSLLLVNEYGKVSIRGESELTNDQGNKTSGLDKDYILNDYSYGIDETMNLFIPNSKGGASSGFDTNSQTYKELKAAKVQGAKQIVQRSPLAYWGTQRFTSGPVYIGAAIIFLFVLGLFLVRGPVKWWLASAVVFSVFLAWGKNFMFLSEFFIHYVPGYNKFRTVSMILVIAEFAIPLFGILVVRDIFDGTISKEAVLKGLKNSLYIVGGIALLFTVFPGLFFDFSAPIDEQLRSSGWPDQLLQSVRDDRKHLLQADAFRSLIFVILTAGLIAGFIFGKVKKTWFILGLAIIFLADMWPVNRRYLNNDNFTVKREIKDPFKPSPADLQILQDKDPDFRVLNLTVNTFNDASTSWFHKSIGGYHGAKIRRYQDLITQHISQNNMNVLNMLNTKYIIVPNDKKQPVARMNPAALGNAWFVSKFRMVENPDEEIHALTDFDPSQEAIVDKRFVDYLKGLEPVVDSVSSIKLVSYLPNDLIYESSSTKEGLAVFSEIYYKEGWKAFIDGKESSYIRVNYILRALRIPAGEHKIEFKFEPKLYYTGQKISLASSIILLLLFFGLAGKSIMDEMKKPVGDAENTHRN